MIQIDDHPEPHRTSQSLICVVGTPKVIGWFGAVRDDRRFVS